MSRRLQSTSGRKESLWNQLEEPTIWNSEIEKQWKNAEKTSYNDHNVLISDAGYHVSEEEMYGKRQRISR